jgi:hypothetical protein
MVNTRKNTYRKDVFSISAGAIYKLSFKNTIPNHFIISSSIADSVYFSDTPNVSASKYSKKMVGVSRQLYAEVNGINTMYIYSSTSGELCIESYYADFTESSIAGDITSLSGEALSSPIPLEVVLEAGVEQTVKLTPGWIVCFGAGINAYTEIRNGTGNTVWKGDYIASQPFYCDISIILYSSVDNAYVSIVYI